MNGCLKKTENSVYRQDVRYLFETCKGKHFFFKQSRWKQNVIKQTYNKDIHFLELYLRRETGLWLGKTTGPLLCVEWHGRGTSPNSQLRDFCRASLSQKSQHRHAQMVRRNRATGNLFGSQRLLVLENRKRVYSTHAETKRGSQRSKCLRTTALSSVN